MNFGLTRSTLGVVLSLLVCSCSNQQDLHVSAVDIKDSFEVHIASLKQDDLYSMPMDGPGGKQLFLDQASLITETHIRDASITVDVEGRPAVVLDLTEVGIEILLSRSDDYVDRKFAILWDGQVVSAPTVMTPLGSKLMIIGGEDSLSDELIHEIVERLKDQKKQQS